MNVRPISRVLFADDHPLVLKTAVDSELVEACSAGVRGAPCVHPSGGR